MRRHGRQNSAPQGRVEASVGNGSDHTIKDLHTMRDFAGKPGAVTTRRLWSLSVEQEEVQAELGGAIS